MTAPRPPPDLKIPASNSTVDVSIIDTTCFVLDMPVNAFTQPEMPSLTTWSAPSYSFLIKHHNPSVKSKYDTMIFDLGIRKDWENGPPALVEGVKSVAAKIEIEKNVIDILRENGEDPANVGAIIWSHHHFDHTGDPSTFPPTTDLIVGPGFKSNFVPAYPTVPDAVVSESAWAGRNLREISFVPTEHDTADDARKRLLLLGSFRAYDFFGDGSFYLLDSPGHAVGHICGLARTRGGPNPEFIVMGGDIAHHNSEFRPTEYLPLPAEIRPDPRLLPSSLVPRGNNDDDNARADAHARAHAASCPGALFEALHPAKSSTTPFMRPGGAVHADIEEAIESVEKWIEFDAQENVFAVTAHDESLYDLLEFYPKPANDWSKKGWKVDGRWRFLKDFDLTATA